MIFSKKSNILYIILFKFLEFYIYNFVNYKYNKILYMFLLYNNDKNILE